MNSPMFFELKEDEDPYDFFDDVYKILFSKGVTPIEKVELVAYQLKDVLQTWYKQLRENRVLIGDPITWEIFKTTFIDRIFPIDMREAKVEEFINLLQESMSVLEYSLKFTKFF